jgi:hypothetical protein
VAIDLKDLLKKAQAGQLRGSAIRLPNGAMLKNVQINGLENAQPLAYKLTALNCLGLTSPPFAAPDSTHVPPVQAQPPSGLMLSDRVSRFLRHFALRRSCSNRSAR